MTFTSDDCEIGKDRTLIRILPRDLRGVSFRWTAWVMKAAFAAALLLLTQATLAAPPVIGQESSLKLPESALWSIAVNFRPGNGDTVDLNPPRFSWLYTPNARTMTTDIADYEFQFQVAYTPTFSNPVVNKRTPWNFYNLLAPFTNNTVFWRVGYVDVERPSFTNWSSVRSFTVSSNAVNWDRSMLADTNYLAQRGRHPHLFFDSNSRSNLAAYLAASGGVAWSQTVLYANYAITNTWMEAYWDTNTSHWYIGTNAFSAVSVTDRAFYLQATAFVWQMTRDPKYTNGLSRAVSNMNYYYMAVGGDHTDSSGLVSGELIRCLGVCYDFLYEIMSPAERLAILKSIEANCKFLMRGGGWWQPRNTAINYGKGDPTFEYAGPYHVQGGCLGKVGDSHGYSNFQRNMLAALAAYPESIASTNYAQSGAARELFDMVLNYTIGRTYPYGGEGGPNQGRTYSSIGIFNQRALYIAMLCQIAFPEAQFNRNPFFATVGDWFSRMLPVGYFAGHEAWGDTGYGASTDWIQTGFGKALAGFTGDGKLLQHFNRQDALWQGYRAPAPWDELAFPFHFPPPATEANSTSARVFPIEGWAMSSTYPPNTTESFTNGVGIIFQARPSGSEMEHSHLSDGSFQIWAYGAAITDAGAGEAGGEQTGAAKVPYAHYTLTVNGLGQCQPRVDYQSNPSEPFYSTMIAFTNNSEFTYCAADLTRAYARSNFSASGWLLPWDFYVLHSGAPLKYLSKVQRHILFQRKKFFVIYDTLETANAPTNTFSWLYHILEPTLNLNTQTMSFTYTATNYYNGNNVAVHVAHVVDSAKLTVTSLTGTNVRVNPLTGENYWKNGTDNYGDRHPRSHALWFSNKYPTNRWHFMTVVYPVKPGFAAPQITRLDDFTVEVINGVERDVISFDSQTTQPATLIVDLSAFEQSSLARVRNVRFAANQD